MRRTTTLLFLAAVVAATPAMAVVDAAGDDPNPHELVVVPPVSPHFPEREGDTGRLEWPNEPPADTPFERSEEFSGIAFTGPWTGYGALGDTWYPSWGADDKLYSPYMDGFCGATGSYGGYPFPITTVGTAVIEGDDPNALEFSCGTMQVDRGDWDGRYASASLHHDGIWYLGSYLLEDDANEGAEPCGLNYCTLGPFVGFDISTDGGHSWERTPHTAEAPLFGETIADGHRVQLGALHVVDHGKDNEHAPDGYVYLVGHGGGDETSHTSWVSGSDVYLTRVQPSPETINDPDAYEFYAGTDAAGEPIWADELADVEPLVSWHDQLGSVTITYDAPLDRYLMWISRPNDGRTTTNPYDTMLLESDAMTGTWRLVHYLQDFGLQAFFVNSPSRFMSPDGTRMWLWYSANFANYEGSDPEGSNYYLVVRELELVRR